MTAFRRRLSWVACAWLCCQLSILTAAPVSLFAHSPDAAGALSCTCSHTGHDACPMHHPKPTDARKRGDECRSATNPDAASIVSLLGPTAVLASAPSQLAPPSFKQLTIYPINKFIGFIAPLDSPPPRA